jgi:hypothetical protein
MIKNQERYRRIATLQGMDGWAALVEEMEDQERKAFESLLHGSTKEEVAATVIILRILKALPETAIKILKEGSD